MSNKSLIARLRDEAKLWHPSPLTGLCNEAADELERLTPTEEDKLTALNCISSPYEYTNHARALLRKYVLREKP